MPRKPHFTDLDLILLSTALAREDGHLYPLKASIVGKADDVAVALTGLLQRKLVEKTQVSDPRLMWREEGNARIGLVITAKARALIDGEDAQIATETSPAAPTSMPPRPGSKIEAVLTLLGREAGASSAELSDATGWLPHTTRAALSGLRKKGHVIERRARGDLKVYRLMLEA